MRFGPAAIGRSIEGAVRWVGDTTRAVVAHVVEHNLTGAASQFAYNAFLATIPFLFVVVSVIRLSGSKSYTRLFTALDQAIPGAARLTETFSQTSADAGRASIIIVVGVVSGLYVVSNAIGALVRALEDSYHRPHRPWLRGKVVNFGFAAVTSVLVVASTAALVGGPRLIRGLARFLGASKAIRDLANQIALPIGVLTLFAFTLLLYRFGPDGMKLRLRALTPGALIFVGAWFGMTRLFGLYVAKFDSFNAVYGSLGAVVVYLTFLYFSGLILLIGAEINHQLDLDHVRSPAKERRRGRLPLQRRE